MPVEAPAPDQESDATQKQLREAVGGRVGVDAVYAAAKAGGTLPDFIAKAPPKDWTWEAGPASPNKINPGHPQEMPANEYWAQPPSPQKLVGTMGNVPRAPQG